VREAAEAVEDVVEPERVGPQPRGRGGAQAAGGVRGRVGRRGWGRAGGLVVGVGCGGARGTRGACGEGDAGGGLRGLWWAGGGGGRRRGCYW
jgi:hypothetical protein